MAHVLFLLDRIGLSAQRLCSSDSKANTFLFPIANNVHGTIGLRLGSLSSWFFYLPPTGMFSLNIPPTPGPFPCSLAECCGQYLPWRCLLHGGFVLKSEHEANTVLGKINHKKPSEWGMQYRLLEPVHRDTTHRLGNTQYTVITGHSKTLVYIIFPHIVIILMNHL